MNVKAIEWTKNQLRLLDQRELPRQETYIDYADAASVADAIRDMVVRGAPAIGISAAYAVVLQLQNLLEKQEKNWRENIAQSFDVLAQSRPTAVNLFWAIKRMRAVVEEAADLQQAHNAALQLACAIHEEDLQANLQMGRYGAEFMQKESHVLTHCNAGALATGGHGTALGVIRQGFLDGNIVQVYADETRPWFQGSRLTAWELQKDNIPVTLIADSAAAFLMQRRKLDWIIVGSDRIAANGDVANKIGTYSAIVNARHHGVKVMVAAPLSTIDLETASGADIPIEARAPDELLRYHNEVIGSPQTDAWNPVFDVTPAALIDVLVTEKGALEKPDKDKIAALF